jgi:hypothetical protein
VVERDRGGVQSCHGDRLAVVDYEVFVVGADRDDSSSRDLEQQDSMVGVRLSSLMVLHELVLDELLNLVLIPLAG